MFTLSYYSYYNKTANSIITNACMKHLQNLKNCASAGYKVANKFLTNHHGLAQSFLLINKLAMDKRKRRSPIAPMMVTAVGRLKTWLE